MTRSQPFDWLVPFVPPGADAHSAEQAREARRRELRDRAALLMRLGRSQSEVTERLRQNLRWEWEMQPPAPGVDEIADLVAAVYGRTLTLDPGRA